LSTAGRPLLCDFGGVAGAAEPEADAVAVGVGGSAGGGAGAAEGVSVGWGGGAGGGGSPHAARIKAKIGRMRAAARPRDRVFMSSGVRRLAPKIKPLRRLFADDIRGDCDL
jgi:hypothetical protein